MLTISGVDLGGASTVGCAEVCNASSSFVTLTGVECIFDMFRITTCADGLLLEGARKANASPSSCKSAIEFVYSMIKIETAGKCPYELYN